MFQISLLDHLRITFGGVVHEYRAHSDVADRLTRRAWEVRIGELLLLGGALAANVTALVNRDPRYAVLSAVLVGGALVLFAIYVALNLESRVYAHRWCASRLWLIREKYRALLSEMQDDALTLDIVRARRDQLIEELHAIVEQAPAVDRATYRAARETLKVKADSVITDEEIDPFLPPSLRSTPPQQPPLAQH